MEKLNKKLRQIFLGIAFVYSAAVFTGCGTVNIQPEDVVMEIAGEQAVCAEYEMILKGYVSEVKRQYSTDEVNRKAFWTTEINGTLPLEQIMQLAQEDLIYKKTVAALAKKAGIEQVSDFTSIMKQMEKQTSKEGMKYGLQVYEAKDYYTYIYTSLESNLMEVLKQERKVSEEELRENYDEHIQQYTSAVNVRMLIAEMHADAGMELAAQTAVRMKEETDMELLHAEYPDVNFYELEMSSLNTEEGKSGGYRLRWLTAAEMQEGETCEPFAIGKNIMVMRCLERKENVAADFEDVQGVIKSNIQTKWAKEEIAGAVQAAEVIYDQDILKKIALEVLSEE